MENKQLTLGSLFDGSGGFPLGGLLTEQITPLWSSEIEPFAIRVTTKRLPQVKHYGDVSAISGADLPPVDIITFGSPCQDMSIAGKRDGLDGSRSSLFYEAIRIVKEMRCKTNGEKPRFIVWENVPGAFSSNKRAGLQSSPRSSQSVLKNRPPRCLRLRRKGGPTQTTTWETDGASRIEFLMHSGGAFPKEENVSTLSQILQTRVPQRYYLSPKACLGILRRASVRGKELPPVLKAALERQAATEQEDGSV